MNFNESIATQQTCACDKCDCPVNPSQGVVKDGKNYCCQGCADGTGCKNPNCDCNKS